MTKIKVAASLVVFEPQILSTDPRIGFKLASVAGKTGAEIPKVISDRVKNLGVGCGILLRQMGGARFSNFLHDVTAEIANNSALYEKIIPGDGILTLSRKSDGDYISVTDVDLRGFLDFLPAVSAAGSVLKVSTDKPEEVEF